MSDQCQEFIFREHCDSEVTSFCEFASSSFAGNHVARFCRHAAGGFAAMIANQLFNFVTGVADHRSGYDTGFSGQRLAGLVIGGGWEGFPTVQAERLEFGQQVFSVVGMKESVYGGGNDLTDFVDLTERFRGLVSNGLQSSKSGGQCAGIGLAHMPNIQL